jgi:hypothetical protein
MLEPGLDRHEWESELRALEPELEDSPREALSELADLVERMLEERGYDLDDAVAREGDDRGVVQEYLAARETSDAIERGDDQVGPGDVASAVNGLRGLAEYVLDERRTP